MKYNFSKYQGLGNDFIIFDARGNNLDNLFTENKDNFIEHLCNRNFGIGADGIILVLDSKNKCFVKMRIFNSDGSEPEMCGNGIRCLIAFLNDNNEIKDNLDSLFSDNLKILKISKIIFQNKVGNLNYLIPQ